MNITFEEIKTPSQMKKKDFIRLGNKILFVKTMHNFWPWCGTCGVCKMASWPRYCGHGKARIGFRVEIDKNNNHPIIRWRKGDSGICKYYEKEEI